MEKDWDSIMFCDKSNFHLINLRVQKVMRPCAMISYKQLYVVDNYSASMMV
jgi:hypothetical protein